MPRPCPPTRFVLIGAGGHATVVADAILQNGYAIVGCIDDNRIACAAGQFNLPIVGTTSNIIDALSALTTPVAVHAAIGCNDLRARWLQQAAEWAAPAVIHPRAIVSPSANIAEGVFIGPGAIVNAAAHIGRGAIINSGAIVEHHVTIGEITHVAPGATIGGGATVGSHTLIGLNATVLPGKSIGHHVTLAAGGVAVNSIADHATAMGVPARPVSSLLHK